MSDRLALASDVTEDTLEGPCTCVPALPQRIQTHAEGGAEQPKNA